MTGLAVGPNGSAELTQTYPHRTVLMAAESLVAVAAVAGAVQLWAGVATPPPEAIEPLGLTTWKLPGVWLFASVAVPSATAVALLHRRSPRAPTAVLVASGLLATELVVQIPFVGPSALQAVLGSVAVGVAGVALHARRSGWPRA